MRNDHAEVTKELEKRLSELHLQAGVTKGVAAMELTREAIEKQRRDEDDAFMRARARAAAQYGAPPGARAFAYVDEVTPGSPASTAGMRVGDVVLMFGDVVGPHEAGTLPRVAAALAEREGHPVAVWVSRGGVDVRLDVTPRRWEGGGCWDATCAVVVLAETCVRSRFGDSKLSTSLARVVPSVEE